MEQSFYLTLSTPKNKARQRFDDAGGEKFEIFILKYNVQALI